MKSEKVTFEATVAGIPVLVEATVSPPEPDVGIDRDYASEILIYWRPHKWNGKLYEVPQSVYDKADMGDIEDQALRESYDAWVAAKEDRGDYFREQRRDQAH